jgi:hypothetical protein
VWEKTGTSAEFQVVSSPHRREHTIFWPASDSPAGPPREIELLHELVHALLCEQVHHQFSGHYFKRGTPETQIQIVAWACRAAADWFVDARLMKLAPDWERAEIQEHFGIVCRVVQAGPPQGDLFFLLSAGLMIAQAVKYLGIQVRTAGQLAQVVNAFLSTPPEKPSVRALEELINKLLTVYTGLRVRLVNDGGLEVWEVVTC